jgi:flagellar protein FliS
MAAVRDAYSNESVVTTPERLITMLYDRLARDLIGAEAAIERKDREAAHGLLIHAQEIVFELLRALDLDAWDSAIDLARLYAWMLRQLAEGNIEQDATKVRHVRSLVEPLGEAWHAAANEVATNAFGTAV